MASKATEKKNKKRQGPSLMVAVLLAFPFFFGVNWLYHATRKPSEVIGLLDGHFFKGVPETWAAYGPAFRANATCIMTPELLAALAQAESRGNPIARTFWTWHWSINPFKIYSPASSAAGMFQITEGTFQEAKRFCIRHGEVFEEGPWYELSSCWFNGFYNRLLPRHAIEMTSAYLHYRVTRMVHKYPISPVPLALQQQLAVLIHLCGAQFGEAFLKHGFRLRRDDRCAAHDPRVYLERVETLRREFARLNR